jgi:hypothetical protein
MNEDIANEQVLENNNENVEDLWTGSGYKIFQKMPIFWKFIWMGFKFAIIVFAVYFASTTASVYGGF